MNVRNFILIAVIYLAAIFVVYFIYRIISNRRAVDINKSATINKKGRNKF